MENNDYQVGHRTEIICFDEGSILPIGCQTGITKLYVKLKLSSLVKN